MKLLYAAVLTLTLLLAGCAHRTTTLSTCSSDGPADWMALRELQSTLPTDNYLDVWISRNYDVAYWNAEFARQQKRIDDLRRWAGSLSDECSRLAYLDWLDYYQNELNSGRSELVSQSEKREMDRYTKDTNSDFDGAKRYQAEHNIPIPPKEKP